MNRRPVYKAARLFSYFCPDYDFCDFVNFEYEVIVTFTAFTGHSDYVMS